MNVLLALCIVASLCLIGMVHGANAFNADAQARLQTAKDIYVATKRSNSEWSTSAPVWFMYDGEAIYLTASPASYKARRIKRGSPVRIWVGSKDGPSFIGQAQFMNDRAAVERMAEAYKQKYWIAWLGLFRPVLGESNQEKPLPSK